MSLADSIEPITQLKTKSAELVRRAAETARPIIITQNGRAAAVLQDVESYERQQQALFLLKLFAQGEQQIRQGKGLTQAKAERHFNTRIRQLSQSEKDT